MTEECISQQHCTYVHARRLSDGQGTRCHVVMYVRTYNVYEMLLNDVQFVQGVIP